MISANAARSGRLITLEGGEGVGKSTNIAFVVEWLEQRGHTVVSTREPGGTPRAEQMRELLLDPQGSEPLDADAELLLVFAARAQHLAQKIVPALQRGALVVCDRFIDATYAYQGVGRGIDSERIGALEQWVLGDLRPDLTLLLDMPEQAARQRVMARGAVLDRFEEQASDFFRAVREGYLVRAEAEQQRFAVIDASQPLEGVQQRIGEVLEQRLQQWGLA
ncbi:dTMP kinase [Carnimonas bestiolae]|uniref:dTMP kinase n=1 Tax=Carnimonas bestiolae TaxID=3402172 RepID=UPI003EDC9C04